MQLPSMYEDGYSKKHTEVDRDIVVVVGKARKTTI
jgi:hypothetical protein